jgi:hypothetical protein
VGLPAIPVQAPPVLQCLACQPLARFPIPPNRNVPGWEVVLGIVVTLAIVVLSNLKKGRRPPGPDRRMDRGRPNDHDADDHGGDDHDGDDHDGAENSGDDHSGRAGESRPTTRNKYKVRVRLTNRRRRD